MLDAKQRVSLTKKQAESETGTALLDLCKSLTDDGVLTDDEVEKLHQFLFLQSNELPAVAYLQFATTAFFDPENQHHQDHRQLYQAIEKILPPTDRQTAKSNRKNSETKERDRNRCLQYNNFMIAGCKHKDRAENIESLNVHDPVTLEREPDNPKDKNAVVIYSNGLELGYVPRTDAKEVATMLDNPNIKYMAWVTKLLGDYSDKTVPVVAVKFYKADSDAVSESNPFYVTHKKEQAPGGCGLTVLMIISGSIGLLYAIAKSFSNLLS
jgi:hypothetical protein